LAAIIRKPIIAAGIFIVVRQILLLQFTQLAFGGLTNFPTTLRGLLEILCGL
jgi:hypothetical protein